MYRFAADQNLSGGGVAQASPTGRRGLWPALGELGPRPAKRTEGAIAVIGIAGRFPRSSTVEELWERLRAGEDCVVNVPEDRWERTRTFRLPAGCRWGGFIDDFDRFDADFFENDLKAAECTDPQERVLLQVVWHLLERAGYTRRRLQDACDSAVGFYVGAANNDYSHLRAPSSWWVESLLSTLNHGTLANRVSHFLDLRGPSLAVDTFCSSAAVALHMACQALRSGDCKMAIAAGVNLILHPDRFEALRLTRHLATRETSRSFADGDGYIPAEAVGAVLLKPLPQAVDDRDNIIGLITATAVNHGGRAAAFGVPNPDAQAELIESCLRKAGCTPASIGYIEASASGAALGDPLELAALRRVFGKGAIGRHSWPIGSVKSNLGHAEAASGITQLAKVLLQLQHRQMIPSIMTDPPNPRLNWADLPFHLVRDLQEWKPGSGDVGDAVQQPPRRALLNSFGAGGTNVTVLLEEYEPAPVAARGVTCARADGRGNEEVIILSARNRQQLRSQIQQLLQFVSASAELDIADMAYTLQIGREAMSSRVAIVATDREGVIAGLNACLRGDLPEPGALSAEVPVFVGEVAGANLFGAAAAAQRADAGPGTAVDWTEVAREWTRGSSIHWLSLRRERRRPIVLPTYPFNRDRCWAAVLTHHHPGLDSEAASLGPHVGSVRGAAGRLPDRDRAEYVAPRNALEQSLAEIWEEVMGARPIGVRDSFFDVGGDSMLAGLVINRCQEEFGIRVDVSVLLGREATIERLAVATVAALAGAQAGDDGAAAAMIDQVMKGRTQ